MLCQTHQLQLFVVYFLFFSLKSNLLCFADPVKIMLGGVEATYITLGGQGALQPHWVGLLVNLLTARFCVGSFCIEML